MSSEQFERKLREKFSHAKIPPNPELWGVIEQRISPPARKRRGGVYWLFFELIIISLLFIGIWNSSSTSSVNLSMAASGLDFRQSAPVEHFSQPKPEPNTGRAGEVPTSNSRLERSSTNKQVQVAPALADMQTEIHLQKVKSDSYQSPSIAIIQPADTGESSAYLSATLNRSANSPILPQQVERRQKHSAEPESYEVSPIRYKAFNKYELNSSTTTVKTETHKLLKRWSFHAFVAPQYSFNRFSPVLVQENLKADYAYTYPSRYSVSNYQNIERVFAVDYPTYSISAGLHLEYQLSERLSLQTGVNFTRYSSGNYTDGELPQLSQDELALGPYLVNFQSAPIPVSQFRFSQLELPIWINYNLIQQNRSSIRLSLGGAINRGFSKLTGRLNSLSENSSLLNNADFIRSGGNRVDTNNLTGLNTITHGDSELLLHRTYFFHAQASLLYNYRLNPGLSIYTGPQFAYQLMPVYEGNGAAAQLPFRVGLRLGIRFHPYR